MTDIMGRVPNQPKTKIRAVRVPDDLWEAAQSVAAERGESVSDEIRRSLERYVKRNRK
jgi:predicted HicB family RNase H-like nuclease